MNNFFNTLFGLFGNDRTGARKKALIFAFFLTISIVIWLLKALEKNYATQIDYPIRYRNFPDDKTLIGDLPDHLKLDVYAHGYVLLQHKISSRYIPLVLNVNSFTLKPFRERDSAFYFLETRFLRDYIDKQLSPEFEILDVKPDTLVFPFAEVEEKRIRVKQNFDFQLEQQMILKQAPLIEPDSIMVTGPDYILDTLKTVYTQGDDLGVISKDKKIETGLQSIEYTTFHPEKVSIKIEVERFTEKTLSIPIRVNGAPDTVNIITFPKQIALSCQVGLSNYEKVQSEMFTASVNYSEIQDGLARLEVKLTKSPDFVRAIKYNPKTIEYLIKK